MARMGSVAAGPKCALISVIQPELGTPKSRRASYNYFSSQEKVRILPDAPKQPISAQTPPAERAINERKSVETAAFAVKKVRIASGRLIDFGLAQTWV